LEIALIVGTALGATIILLINVFLEVRVSFLYRMRCAIISRVREVSIWLVLPIMVASSCMMLVWSTETGSSQVSLSAIPATIIICMWWVICLCVLKEIGDAFRFPLIALFVITGVLSTLFLGSYGYRTPFYISGDATADDPATRKPLPKAGHSLVGEGKASVSFVVAAQGGGIYAGFHAAIALARMQDHCPAFARHIRIMSGVSGGSLGLAVFAAAVQAVEELRLRGSQEAGDGSCTPLKSKLHERLVQDFFSGDFLTPLIARGAFVDAILVAFPIDKVIRLILGDSSWEGLPDRAAALENAISSRWGQTIASLNYNLGNYFERNALQKFGSSPPVIYNATCAETGHHLVMRPISGTAGKRASEGTIDLAQATKQVMMPVKTAVIISSRFPVVMPPALLGRGAIGMAGLGDGRSCNRLLDGGILDNSGMRGSLVALSAETGLDLLQQSTLLEFQRASGVDLRFIIFSHEVRQTYGADFASIISSPVAALSNSSDIRGMEYLDRLRREWGKEKVFVLPLAQARLKPRLGWIMSNRARIVIGKSVDEKLVPLLREVRRLSAGGN
jgi:hypothetical protein